jgi:predicted ribosomally synthesized peptide with SipW-like signal peptide
MKKILLSTALILFVGGALALGSTGAFFSDSETSGSNTFAAGSIDLKIDNSSYYNGVLNPGTTWELSDLTIEKFFDFLDLKPADYGEDTISLHVDTNDAYLCANVTLTSNNDNGINEPEAGDGDVTAGVGEGELADNVKFIWWADDGDNVLEQGENVISQGPIGELQINEPYPFTLADSDENIWTGIGGPVKGEETLYIGKAWCFGDISSAPLPQSSLGGRATTTPAQDGNGNQIMGEPADGGFLCNGSQLNNITQTDSLTADVTFTAIQSRNNANYQCASPRTPSATLTLLKTVINDDFGTALDTAWTLSASGPTNISGIEGAVAVTGASVNPGEYILSESGGPIGYVASQYSCVINGGNPVIGNNITLADGDVAICTITNDDTEPLACNAGQQYADSSGLFDQGRTKLGALIVANRSNPSAAFGAPQTTGTPTDAGFPAGSFVSLGFGVGTTSTRSLVLNFDNNLIVDGPGADVRVYEVTGGVYPDEHIKVEVSQNGTTWVTVVADGVRDINADLSGSGLAWAKYVRVTDLNLPANFSDSVADGYDVDAVEALNCVQPFVNNI